MYITDCLPWPNSACPFLCSLSFWVMGSMTRMGLYHKDSESRVLKPGDLTKFQSPVFTPFLWQATRSWGRTTEETPLLKLSCQDMIGQCYSPPSTPALWDCLIAMTFLSTALTWCLTYVGFKWTPQDKEWLLICHKY